MSFQEIPTVDLSQAFDSATKPQFLKDLRHAIINVGFLLLKNYQSVGPNDDDFAKIKTEAINFFDLPDKFKEEVEMINSPHFLGYTRLANEITDNHADWREQIDLGTELPAPSKDDPIYRNIEGPNLWPDASVIPNFKPTILNYIDKMSHLSLVFKSLVAEAIGLPANAFEEFFKPNQQCKMKLIAYPDTAELTNKSSIAKADETPGTQQGCGPHRDSDLLTYIYQATKHNDSLQVQNWQGEWVTVPYVENTLVVNVGQTLEAITQGVCKATIHRVLIPQAGSGTRISIPFFQTIDLDSYKNVVQNIPEDSLQLAKNRDGTIKQWGQIGFQFIPDVNKDPVGVSVFKNRIKSHQDVARRWYPEILRQTLEDYK
jgi:isopenicillin N synthase-like dioxygenase